MGEKSACEKDWELPVRGSISFRLLLRFLLYGQETGCFRTEMNSMSTPRSSLILAALLGALGVAAGAFGSHILSDVLSPKDLSTYSTGISYLQWHAVYLLALSWMNHTHDNVWFAWARRCGLGGILIFSGSLMALALTGISILGAIAPIGGTMLIASWLLTAWGTKQIA